MSRERLILLAQRLYSLFLRVYPRSYRARFGAPMRLAFEERCSDQISGPRSALRVWAHELPSLLYRGVKERFAPRSNVPVSLLPARQTRMTRIRRWCGGFLDDTAHTARMLRRRPTYTLIVLATLMLGIGMNTAIFSVLYGVLLQPLPFDDPEQLVRIGRASPDSQTWLNPISPAEFRDLEARLQPLEIAGAASGGRIMSDDEGAELVLGSIVTRGLFDLLGVRPQRGRFFSPDDVAADADPVVVISDSFWRNRLGGDPDVLDATVELGGTDFRIIGVAPPGFGFRPNYGLSGAEYWEPVQWTTNALQSRHGHYLMIYGRLDPETDIAAANDEISALWRDVVAQDPGNHLDDRYELGLRATPLRQFNVTSSRDPLVFLTGAVALILLIACANVANLLLSNAESRQHELAVRAAIGAGKARLMRQFLTEALVLAVIGGALGVTTAYFGVRAMLSAFPDAVARSTEVGLHLPVLAFATCVSALVALVLGAATSMQADLESADARAGRTLTRRRSVFRKALIVAEVTLALVLVIAAGLMLKSYWKLSRADLGFMAENVLAVNVTLPAARYQNAEARADYHERLAASLAARPEVAGVGMTNLVPVRSFGNNISGLSAVGEPDRSAHYVEVRYVTPGYHETLGVPLVLGRGLTRADVDSEARVVLINQTLSRQLFGDGNPIGRQLGFDDPAEVVGVVGDTRAFGPDRDVAPYVYFPVRYAGNVVVRVQSDAEAFVPQLRSIIREIDAEARAWRIETMAAIVADALGDRRFQLLLIGTFALVAMALGAIGTYGVMAYSIETQMPEFGIRVAVGATAADIRRLVLGGAGALAALGLALGLAGAYALRHFVANLLVEVEAWDPMVYGGTALAMALVALLACWIPTRRAVRADPVEVLRRE